MSQNLTQQIITIAPNSGKIKIGGTVAKNDLLSLDEHTGKARVVEVSDYAAVGNVNLGTDLTGVSSGEIVPQTLISTYSMNSNIQYGDFAILRDSATANLFILVPADNIGQGTSLYKFRPNGEVIGYVDIDTLNSAAYQNRWILELSNGNLCVVTVIGNAATIKFAIYDKNLNLVKALTTVTNTSSATWYFSAIKLSSGGFAIVYNDSVTTREVRAVTYDNAGTVVTANFLVWSRPGTPAYSNLTVKELSNSNLFIAINSTDTGSGFGLYYAIYTQAGVQVKAATNLETTNISSVIQDPTVDVIAGTVCISRRNGTNQMAWVLDNAGTVQGAGFTTANTLVPLHYKERLLNDGTNYYLIWQRSTDSKFAITKIPVTGTNYVTATLNPGQYNVFFDAFYDIDGFIVVNSTDASNDKNHFWVIDLSTLTLVYSGMTDYGIDPVTNAGNAIKIIGGGDKSFISMYTENGTPTGTFLCIGKYAKTAIMGAAESSGVLDDSISFKSTAGFYEINPVKGSLTKAFDMSTNTLVGNKGTIIKTGSAVLKGIGV
jgi:hypothetical protein